MSSAVFLDLQRHADGIALVEGERVATYATLAEKATEFARSIGPDRSLVFLEARNQIATVVAYLGCLIGGHPVFLFSQDQTAIGDLISVYQPNVVIFSRNGGIETTRLSIIRHNLHDQLAVLLSTFGSSGTPKFVKLSRQNLQSNAASICNYLSIGQADRAITSLDFNYSYGMSVVNSHQHVVPPWHSLTFPLVRVSSGSSLGA